MLLLTRIVPHTRWTALLLPNFVAGVVFGLPVVQWVWMSGGGGDRSMLVVIGVALGALLVWQALCARVSQAYIAILGGAIAFTVGLDLSVLIACQRLAPDGLLVPARWRVEWLHGGLALVMAVMLAAIPVCAVVAGLLMRWVLVRVVPQPSPQPNPAPPRLCWKCGYDLIGLREGGGDGGGVCPECGDNLTTARPRARRLFATVDWSWRRRRIIIAVLLAVFMGFEGWLYVTRALPVARFVRTFKTLGPELDTSWFTGPVRTIAYAVPIGNPEGWSICIRYHPRVNGYDEEMYLHLVQPWFEAGK